VGVAKCLDGSPCLCTRAGFISWCCCTWCDFILLLLHAMFVDALWAAWHPRVQGKGVVHAQFLFCFAQTLCCCCCCCCCCWHKINWMSSLLNCQVLRRFKFEVCCLCVCAPQHSTWQCVSDSVNVRVCLVREVEVDIFSRDHMCYPVKIQWCTEWRIKCRIKCDTPCHHGDQSACTRSANTPSTQMIPGWQNSAAKRAGGITTLACWTWPRSQIRLHISRLQGFNVPPGPITGCVAKRWCTMGFWHCQLSLETFEGNKTWTNLRPEIEVRFHTDTEELVTLWWIPGTTGSAHCEFSVELYNICDLLRRTNPYNIFAVKTCVNCVVGELLVHPKQTPKSWCHRSFHCMPLMPFGC